MKVNPREINGMLSPVLTKGRISFQLETSVKEEEEIEISFDDFIRAQLTNKVIQLDYSILAKCCRTLNLLNYGANVSAKRIQEDITEPYMIFKNLTSTLGIITYLRLGVKIIASFPELFNLIPTDEIEYGKQANIINSVDRETVQREIDDLLINEGLVTYIDNIDGLDLNYLTQKINEYKVSKSR